MTRKLERNRDWMAGKRDKADREKEKEGEAKLRLAYTAVFRGHANPKEAYMVLSDLARYCGFYDDYESGKALLNSRFLGKRSVYCYILRQMEMQAHDDIQMHRNAIAASASQTVNDQGGKQ